MADKHYERLHFCVQEVLAMNAVCDACEMASTTGDHYCRRCHSDSIVSRWAICGHKAKTDNNDIH